MKFLLKLLFVMTFLPFYLVIWSFRLPFRHRRAKRSHTDNSYIDEFEIIDEILS